MRLPCSIVRLGILFLLLFLIGLWGWLSMFWMPGQSYRATLPPLDGNAIALKEALQKDVQTIAKVIGARNGGHYDSAFTSLGANDNGTVRFDLLNLRMKNLPSSGHKRWAVWSMPNTFIKTTTTLSPC